METLEAVFDRMAQRPMPTNPFPPEVNWNIVHHRIVRAKDLEHPCTCPMCKEYLAMIHEKFYRG